jgi:hypothetical protein
MVRNDLVNYGHRFTAEEYAVSPEMTLGLDPREVTIGDVLKRAGYRTVSICFRSCRANENRRGPDEVTPRV